MNKEVLIFGAGSVGAHHINASRSLGNNVQFTDVNNYQVNYLKKNLYPLRYKKWDKKIEFVDYRDVFSSRKMYDLIVLGVPPIFHKNLLIECIKKLRFKKILVEKPLFVFNQKFFDPKKLLRNKIFCGFNHSVSKSFVKFLNILEKENFGKIREININWKEDFAFILKAHPWIKNLNKSYLSNLNIGGGGIHEYSHAVHLFYLLRSKLLKKKKFLTKKKIEFKTLQKSKYDSRLFLSQYDKKKKISLNIDTISNPPIKSIEVIFDNKKILWERIANLNLEKISFSGKRRKPVAFKIKRADDFTNEHKVLLGANNNKVKSLINYDNSFKTMKLIKSILRNV